MLLRWSQARVSRDKLIVWFLSEHSSARELFPLMLHYSHCVACIEQLTYSLNSGQLGRDVPFPKLSMGLPEALAILSICIVMVSSLAFPNICPSELPTCNSPSQCVYSRESSLRYLPRPRRNVLWPQSHEMQHQSCCCNCTFTCLFLTKW